MTSDQIREIKYPDSFDFHELDRQLRVAQIKFLQEIAAQLAKLNENGILIVK